MRRGVLAVLGTLAGTSLLVGAKIGTPSTPADTVALDTTGAGDAAAAGPAPTPSKPAAKAAAAATTKPKPKPPASKPAAPGSGLKDGTVTGAGGTEMYGTVRVTITVAGGKITRATATYNPSTTTSAQISNDAFPKLYAETLTAQSAKVSTVSGATYTSQGYKASLQSALNAAKA